MQNVSPGHGHRCFQAADKARHAWTATLAPALTREQQAVIITARGYLMEVARVGIVNQKQVSW
jgi:hypothetical protein